MSAAMIEATTPSTFGKWKGTTQLGRFWDRVMPEPNSGCWLWTGEQAHGYAKLNIKFRSLLAHKWYWELVNGPTPIGLELDHKCRVKCCVNPDHLEPVTHRVNVLRGVGACANKARQTHCKRGHLLEGENLVAHLFRRRGHRICRVCIIAARREKHRTRKETARAT